MDVCATCFQLNLFHKVVYSTQQEHNYRYSIFDGDRTEQR